MVPVVQVKGIKYINPKLLYKLISLEDLLLAQTLVSLRIEKNHCYLILYSTVQKMNFAPKMIEKL